MDNFVIGVFLVDMEFLYIIFIVFLSLESVRKV